MPGRGVYLVDYTPQDYYEKGNLVRAVTCLANAVMEYLKDIPIPNHIYPELAYHLARMLCWDNSDDSEVDFFALCLMRTSWDFKEAETMPSILGRLHRLFKDREAEDVLKLLADESFYEEKAKAHDIGSMTVHHLKRALRAAIPQVEATNVPKYVNTTVQALVAAVSDTSPRSAKLGRAALEAIVAMMPSDADLADAGDRVEATEDGVMVITPGGAFGPFPGVREAMTWRARAIAAQAQGLPLPAIARMSQQQVPPASTGTAAPDEAGPRAQVFSPIDAFKVLQRMPPPTVPGEGNSQHRTMLELMTQDDGYRPLTVLTDRGALDEMYERFPHFKEVLDFVKKCLAFAGCGDQAGLVQIPPILLRGVEGTGKSYFAKQLAYALGVQFVSRDLAATSATFVLSGMDSSWKGSKPGIVFDALVNGPTANPVICLNEIDKAKGVGGQGSPMDALYTLLEPEDSQLFKDEFIPVPIDASQVIWICTANEGELPKPILQRLEVFDIKEPTKEHCRTIAASVWNNICTTRLPKGHGFSPELGGPLLDVLSGVRPRVLRKTLAFAAGSAVEKGNKFLSPEDLTASQKRYEVAAPRGIGFNT
jgi:ATP-dependent Lon protease